MKAVLIVGSVFLSFASCCPVGRQKGSSDHAYEINVLDYQADPTGTRTSSSAFSAAHDAVGQLGGDILIPCGIYKLTSTFLISKSRTVVRGMGSGCVRLVGVAGMGPVVQEGNSTASGGDYTFENGIEGLTITRTGQPLPGDIGVFWNGFNYGWERNTLSYNHYISRSYDSLYLKDISIGMDAQMIYAYDAVRTYSYAGRVADLRVNQSEFGKNKSEHTVPQCGVEFSGPANNINYEFTWLIQRAASNKGTMACFTAVSGSGIYRFTNSYAENWQFGFSSDIKSEKIQELTVLGGHLSVGADVFALSPKTTLQGFSFSTITTGGMTLPETTYSSVHDSVIGGNFAAAAGMSGNADLTLTGNTFARSVTLTGVWRSFAMAGNVLPQAQMMNDESSGAKQIVGNVASRRLIPDKHADR